MENESTIADDATVSTVNNDTTTGDETTASTGATSTSEVADEQLIEEISIDGMCGVY